MKIYFHNVRATSKMLHSIIIYWRIKNKDRKKITLLVLSKLINGVEN